MTPEEFKTLRHKMDMTQKEIANFLCKSIRTVQAYEKGSVKVPKIVSKILNHPSFNPYVD